jgi:transcriptional regulator with XRE-family HTH domain
MAKAYNFHPVDRMILKRGLSIKETCHVIGVSEQFWAKVRKNWTLLSINKMLLLASILNISVVVLFNIFYRHSLNIPTPEEIDHQTNELLRSEGITDLDN